MLYVKPYFNRDQDLSLELMDVLSQLSNDTDQDVLEAVEHTDYELLRARKDRRDENEDLEKEEFQKMLRAREKIEAEERKKHSSEDEESKYDMYDLKKWKLKQNKYGFKGRPSGIIKSTVNQGMVNQMKKASQKKEGELDKTPIKRKTTMSINDKKLSSDIKEPGI